MFRRENEGDRVARQRIHQQAELEAAEWRQKAAEISALARRLDAEIPAVVRQLSSHGYPGIELVSCMRYGRFIDRGFQKGGWKLGGFSDADGDMNVFLLSDGTLGFLWRSHDHGTNPARIYTSLSEYIASYLDNIATGNHGWYPTMQRVLASCSAGLERLRGGESLK